MINHAAMLRPRAKLRPVANLTALACAIGASVVAYGAFMTQREAELLARSNDQLRTRQAASRQEPSKQELDLQHQWEVLLRERAYPWANVFRAVEHVSDPEIELLEFRPDRRAGTVVLKGEGRSAESVMRYLELLQANPTFSRVYLAHTANVERGRLSTRAFEMRLTLTDKLRAVGR